MVKFINFNVIYLFFVTKFNRLNYYSEMIETIIFLIYMYI